MPARPPHPGALSDAADTTTLTTMAACEPPASAPIQYIPYRPPNSDFTPPASPQLVNPHAPSAARKGFGSGRRNQPANLHMDTTQAPPAYERPVYSPSPSSSPPLPPLPSPKFALRQRTPSLLRHAATPSPLNNGYPRAEQALGSPTFGPSQMRPPHSAGPTSDPRAIFNALGSNPVNRNSSTWDSTTPEDAPEPPVQPYQHQQRMRGMTSASQRNYRTGPHPPLRSATSIPDFEPVRSSDRSNLSGAYRPNRGGPNWSHNDHYPPRYFRGEEPRASVRSGFTTNSSVFMEASGTERSSMATGRSSISDTPGSTYSRDRSEERDLSSDTLPTTVSREDEDVMSTVEDVIDSYFDDMDDAKEYSDDGPGDRSSDYSQKEDRKFYHAISEPDQALSDNHDPEIPAHSFPESNDDVTSHALSDPNPARPDFSPATATVPSSSVTESPPNESRNNRTSARSSMYQDASGPTVTANDRLAVQSSETALQRSSEEIPRPVSFMAASRTSVHGLPGKNIRVVGRISQSLNKPPIVRQHSGNVHKMQEIHREISSLPDLPKQKSRLSRQDWGEIQAYAKRNSKGAAVMLKTVIPEEVKCPTKPSVDIPDVDEDEAFPRRASTSVFDRRSTLFNLGDIQALSSPTTKMSKSGNPLVPQAGPTVASLRKAMSGAERDRYGFKKATHNISLQEYDAWATKYDEHISRRRNKWIALMTKQGLPTTNPTRFPDQSDRVKRYARKGYPPEWRGAMWWFYSGGQYKLQQPEMAGLYQSLVERINRGELNKDDREAIERDLDRTFPDNIHFRPEPTDEELADGQPSEPSLIKDLREVLSCFALNNPGIGYCQSLNFLAGLLLLFLKQDREKAFVLLTIITQNHLPGAHARSLANTEVNVLMMLIRDYLPKVWASINDTDLVNSGPGSQAHPDSKFQRQPAVALSCTSWFMSIFVGVLPIETVLRVWDAFLYEGPRALYRYALSIFKLGEAEIRKYRPGDGELFMTVQNLPRRCLDPNVLHDLAFVKKGFGSLTQNVIDQKRLFWREQTERAKRAASQRSKPGMVPEAAAASNGSMGGLKRRASRRFLRKKNTGL